MYDLYMGLQTWLLPFIKFLSDTLVPFLVALALLFFLWNLVRYAIIGGANKEDREKARTLMLWGITALFVILFVWGIVNLFTRMFGFQDVTDPITPDYIKYKDPFWDGSYDDWQDPCSQNPNADGCDIDYKGAT